MVWTYLAESEESVTPSKIGLNQSPTAKSTPIVKRSYYLEYPIEALEKPPFGMMLQHLKQDVCLQESTSFMEGFPVKISVLQEMEKAWKESEADYFSRSCAWPKKSNPNSYSLKTCQLSPQEGGFESLKKLPHWGMIVDGVLYPLQALGLHTKEKDGFYWPTPRASDYKRGDSPSDRKRNTPCLITQLNMKAGTKNWKVNLNWMEWLMGYPKEWTGLSLWVMQWFQNKQEKLLKC